MISSHMTLFQLAEHCLKLLHTLFQYLHINICKKKEEELNDKYITKYNYMEVKLSMNKQ